MKNKLLSLLFTRARPAACLALVLFGCLGPAFAQGTSKGIPEDQNTVPKETPATPAQLVVTPPPRNQFHIYLLMGQSNMAGRDRSVLATQPTDPRVLALAPDGQWVVARDPLHQKDGRTEPGAGPGLPFALEMIKSQPGVTIGLVPCAVGGSPLRRWEKGGDLYQRALAKAGVAAKSGILSGVLWHQGETDTTKQPYAETYEARLRKMVENLRSDLGTPQLPIVVGQLGEFLALSPEKYPYAETVRTAIKRVSETVPHVGYADSAGLADKGDKLHFNAAAQTEFGQRYAAAMLKISSNP